MIEGRKIKVPPIKTQGIKTKLTPWIGSILPPKLSGKWIEPFMGSGVVAFNLANKKAILSDTNIHLINFYEGIKSKEINSVIAKSFLEKEGLKLSEQGEKHFYYIRDRFNESKDPLDFLFLNRSCFNGMIRFNNKGKFNVPFCKKPNRFAKAYITKIVNQVSYVEKLIIAKDFKFKNQSFEKAIADARKEDFIYCDPPYIARHNDYFNSWDEAEEETLFNLLKKVKCKFILSTWHYNKYRKNEYIERFWNIFNLVEKEHFYHVGAKQSNRNSMVELLVTNFPIVENKINEPKQISLNIEK